VNYRRAARVSSGDWCAEYNCGYSDDQLDWRLSLGVNRGHDTCSIVG
jgi:hypothetical protein